MVLWLCMVLCVSTAGAVAGSIGSVESVVKTDAEALAAVTPLDIKRWDEARCKEAMARLSDIVAQTESSLTELRGQLNEAREDVRQSVRNRRRRRNVQEAFEHYRELKDELDRNLDRDAALQNNDRIGKAFENEIARLESRKVHIKYRLASLAKEGESVDQSVPVKEYDFSDAEVLMKVRVIDVAQWDRARCEEAVSAFSEALAQARAMRADNLLEREKLRNALLGSDGYERQALRVKTALARHSDLDADFNLRVERDKRVDRLAREVQALQDRRSKLGSLRLWLVNRLNYIQAMEHQDRSREQT